MDAPGDGSRAGHHGICRMNAGRIHRCGDNYKIDAGLKFEAIRVKTTDFAALRVSMVVSVSGTHPRAVTQRPAASGFGVCPSLSTSRTCSRLCGWNLVGEPGGIVFLILMSYTYYGGWARKFNFYFLNMFAHAHYTKLLSKGYKYVYLHSISQSTI